MNDKRRMFCEYYAECLNATEAAKRAGYSAKTAYSQGNRLLKDAEIVNYIKELQEKAASARIADIAEVKEAWTDVLRDKSQRARDRIRAGEMLARSSGEFLPGGTVRQKNQKVSDDPEQDEEKEMVRICLPVIDGETNYNSIERPDGEVVPLAGYEDEDVLIYLPMQKEEDGEEHEQV
jgi:phage terminase small subunit